MGFGLGFDPSEIEIADDLGNPIRIWISDKDNPLLFASVDATGAIKVTGAGGGEQHLDGDSSSGAKGTVALGSDGSNLKFLKTDSDGNLQVDVLNIPNVTLASQVSPFTSDINISLDGEQVDISDRTTREVGRIRIWDGITEALVEPTQQRLKVETQTTSQSEEATFIAYADDVQIANNKSMISVQNTVGSGTIIKVKQIAIRNVRTSAVTGVAADFRVNRASGHSGGTLLTPTKRDTVDVVNANVTIRTGATITGLDTGILDRVKWSSDEWGPGTLDQEGLEHSFQNVFPLTTIFDPSEKRITIREGETLTIQQVTNSSNGYFDIMIVFTQV